MRSDVRKRVMSFTAGPIPFRYAAFALGLTWGCLTFSLALGEIFFFVSLVLFLLECLGRRILPFKGLPKSVWIPLAMYTALSVLSVFWTEYLINSLRGTLKVLQVVILFGMTAQAYSHSLNRRLFEKVFVFFFVLLTINGIHQYFGGTDFIRGFAYQPSGAGPRISASFKSYGLLGAFLILALPYLAMLALRPRRLTWTSVFLGLATAAGLCILFWTRSRGALLAFFAGGLFFLVVKRQWKYLVILTALAAVGLSFLPRNMIIHLDADGREQSLVERFYLWDRAAQVIKARPLTGTGINTYASAHAKYDRRQNWRVLNYYAHNGYLQMAAEIGIPGLLCFLLFVGGFYRHTFRSLRGLSPGPDRDIPLGLITGITCFFVLASVDTVLHSSYALLNFWFFLGLLYAYLPVPSPRA